MMTHDKVIISTWGQHSDLPLKEIAHCADAAIAADAVQPNKPTTTTYLLAAGHFA